MKEKRDKVGLHSLASWVERTRLARKKSEETLGSLRLGENNREGTGEVQEK